MGALPPGGGTTVSLTNTPQAQDDCYDYAYEDYVFCFDVMANDLGGSAKILWSIDDTAMQDDSGTGAYDLLTQNTATSVPEYSDLGAKIRIVDGKIQYDTNPIDWLSAGETRVDTFTYAIRLANGTLSWATVYVTVQGRNDGPAIVAGGDGLGEVTEDSGEAADGTISDSGTFNFTDVDLQDVHTVSITPSASGYLGSLTATVTDDSTNDGSGQVGWEFTVDNAAVQYLAAGQTLTQTYTVTVSDGKGGSAPQTITIQIHGTNDGPDITVEDGDAASAGLSEGNDGLSALGTLTVSDIDTSDVVDVTVTGLDIGGTGGTGSLTEDDLEAMFSLTGGNDDNAADGTPGSLGWTFDSGDQAFDHLAEDETLVLTYTLTADDGHTGSDTQTVTITITGTNDAPTITSAAQSGAVDEKAEPVLPGDPPEGGTLSAGGTVTFADVDLSDTHSASVLAGVADENGDAVASPLGTLNLDPVNQAANSVGWTFTVADGALDHLGANDSLTQVYAIEIDDGHGGTVTQAVTITITGTNDKPVIEASAAGHDVAGAVTERAEPVLPGDPAEGGTHTETGAIKFSDVDVTDTHSATFVAAAGGYVGTFTLADADAVAAGTQTGPGSLGWSFSVDDSALDFLAAGQVRVQTYNVTIDDGHGGTVTQAVTVTITGTNDKPVIEAAVAGHDVAGAVSEKAEPVLPGDPAEGGTHTETGAIKFSDVDVTDTHSATFVAAAGGYLGTFSLADSDLTAAGTQTAPGSLGWSFSVDDSALDFLAAGEVRVQTYNVTIADGHGGTVTQAVTVTITGTNDAPVISIGTDDSASEALTESDSGLSVSGTATVTDVDASDVVDVSVSGVAIGGTGGDGGLSEDALKAMLSLTSGHEDNAADGIAGSLGWTFDSGDQVFDYLGADETLVLTYTLTATDAHGGSDTQTVTITITGTNDAAVLSSAIVELDETNAPLTTGGTLTIEDVDSAETFVEQTDAQGDYGKFSIAADGSWTYVADSAFDELNTGDTLTDTFTVASADGTTTTVTVKITGTNDGPTATNLSAAESYTEDTPLNLINIVASDVDSATVTASLTLSSAAAGALSTGTSGAVTSQYNAVTGVWTATGAVADVNALLAGVTFTPTANFNGTISIATSIDDGVAPAVTGTKVLTGIAVNDAPTAVGLDAAETYTEDTPLNLTDIIVADIDSATVTVTLQLSSPAAGALSTGTSGGATSSYDAASGLWSVTGSQADVNALLAGVIFTPALNFNGNLSIATSVSDGMAPPVTGTKLLTGIPVNDAPTATHLNTAESYTEDTPLNLADIVASDVDSATLMVTLTLSNPAVGTLSIATAGGATSSYDAATGVWSVTGSQADVNALLAGVTFTPAANFNGSFTIATSVSDGVAPAVTGTKAITGIAVNDAPTAIGLDAAETYTEDTPLNLSDIVVADIDSATVTVTLQLSSPAAGALSTGTSGGATSSYDAASGLWSVTGSQADVNALLAGVIFTPALNFNGNLSIATSVSDGVAAPITGTKLLTGIPVNDAPTATNLSASESYTEDTPLNLTDIVVADVDSTNVTVTLTLSNTAAGALSTATSGTVTSTYDAVTGVWTATGAIASVNALLAGVTFTPAANFNGDFAIATSVSDGVAPAITGSKAFVGIPVDDGDPNDNDGLVTATTPVLMTQGSEGAQTLLGSTGNDVLMGGSGNDTMYGGAGDDFIHGYSGNTPALPTEGPVNGQDGDLIYGGSGNDTIFGNQRDDTIYGGSGNDAVNGGLGVDQLWGGLGQDRFIFSAAIESPVTPAGDRDRINDFSHIEGDKIDLTAFTPSNFVGVVASAGAVAANQVGYVLNGDGSLTVFVDTNGAAGADMAITVVGVASLQASDFLL